ncbi:group II intron reverse transcriptase/maturase [Pistricoccus aurantiacus]|uniref:group II intron reverse transcriptase/maturase n=1 Tax=Pistricoccus aurantiacus TaxID=1883414 RepID=UPI001FE8FD85|nr:group II intron reverse transcriptase/maturase [Pistricoccus aurantiacus]
MSGAISDETGLPRRESEGAGRNLLEQAFARENMQRAWKRVKANKGSAGVDGLDIAQPAEYLRWTWPTVRQQLLDGSCRPQPVRRVGIPKPNGSERELGIPTVTDRLIQQALLQVLQPLIDPIFSEHRYGFRPGRRAHDAVLAAQRYVQQGRHIGVDVDLSKVFDRVNHDILIDRLRKRVNNRGVIRLVRAYLNAGIMEGGMVMDRHEGTPQGGPLSPLLANVLLDEGDRALERRGHCFARDADDCNVYVRSQQAGERVMLLLRRCYDKLRLVINEAKSAVTSGVGRKFLGYTLWQGPNGDVRRGVAAQALQAFKLRVRQLPRRSGGRSIEQGVEKLRSYLLGWKGYFKLSQTPPVSGARWMRGYAGA